MRPILSIRYKEPKPIQLPVMTQEDVDKAMARIAEVMEKIKAGVKPDPRYSVSVYGDTVIIEPLSYYLQVSSK